MWPSLKHILFVRTELLLEKGYEIHGIMCRSSSFNTLYINHVFYDHNKSMLLKKLSSPLFKCWSVLGVALFPFGNISILKGRLSEMFWKVTTPLLHKQKLHYYISGITCGFELLYATYSIFVCYNVITQISSLVSLCILSGIVAGVGLWGRALYVFLRCQMIGSSFS